jgi:hypothetical protein
MSTYEKIKDNLSKRYEIVTINAALLNPNKVNVMGADTVTYNLTGYVEEKETSLVRVETKVNVLRILEIYDNGFSLNVKYKKIIPEFISTIEAIIENLYKNKGYNSLATDVKLPDSELTLDVVIRFYLEFTKSNNVLINNLLVEDFKNDVDGLIILNTTNMHSDVNIKTGDKFITEVSGYNKNNETNDKKNKLIRIRDEY